MKNFISDGKTITIAAGTARTSGDVFVSGNLVGIFANDYTTAQVPVLSIEGVFRLPKNTSQAIGVGERVDWDVSAGEVNQGITPAAGDVEDFGVAVEAAAAADAYVNVKLLPGQGTFA